jgi:predicted nucleic acid-binding protein
MKVMLDLNVLLDVIQNRQPHYLDSASVMSAARSGEFVAVIPAHAVTTISYIIARFSGPQRAAQSIDWLLQHFEVAAADKRVLVQARALPMNDFEDAVFASAGTHAVATGS